MTFTRNTLSLTHTAAMAMLAAAIEKADSIGQPQCIVIVDASGESIAELRMNGAKFLSLKSARAKARTAASSGAHSGAIPPEVKPLIALATQGEVTGLPAGLPIRLDGQLIGGIGVGSGSPEQDLLVANAALQAIGASVPDQ